ncbi:MAG: hypothetical protein WDN03_09980 [Rhizomicrobium sp.]
MNLRSARPFDKEGFRLTYNLQGSDVSIADEPGERGAVILSDTWGDFGALIGVAGVHNNVFVKGWEDGNAAGSARRWRPPPARRPRCNARRPRPAVLSAASPGVFRARSRPMSRSRYPAAAAPPMRAGTPIDQAFCSPTIPASPSARFPMRCCRASAARCSKAARATATTPSPASNGAPIEGMHFYVDGIFGRQFNDLNRSDINFGVRAGNGSQPLIPTNMTIAPDWLGLTNGGGGAVTGGTFYNAQFALEARPYREKGDFYSLNPGVEWQVNDLLWADLQFNATRSHFFRDSPTVFLVTCPSAGNAGVPGCAAPAGGVAVNFLNTPGMAFPSITTNINLNDPANYQWNNGRVNLQDEKRFTVTDGAHFDVKYGDDQFSVKAGGAFDPCLPQHHGDRRFAALAERDLRRQPQRLSADAQCRQWRGLQRPEHACTHRRRRARTGLRHGLQRRLPATGMAGFAGAAIGAAAISRQGADGLHHRRLR